MHTARPTPSVAIGIALLLSALLVLALGCKKGDQTTTVTTVQPALSEAVKLRDIYSIKITDEQLKCLGPGLLAEPKIFEYLKFQKGDTATAKTTAELFTRCFGSPRAAIVAINEALINADRISDEQAACLNDALKDMPIDDFVGWLGGDQALIDKYKPLTAPCQGK